MAKPRNPTQPTNPTAPAGDGEDEDFILQKKKNRRARRATRNAMPGMGELNLTAMMDMLTIILVFLLKNYNTSPSANLSAGLNPPLSTSKIAMVEAITVAITRSDISVDDKKVVDLYNGRVNATDRTVQNQPLLITSLKDALLARVEHHKRIEELGGPTFEGNMLVVGDRSIDYELLSQVLYSAGQAQLANFRFVTLSP